MATERTHDLDGDQVARLGYLNYLEFYRELARCSGPAGRVEERDGVLLHASGSAFPGLFNGVARLDDSVEAESVIAVADKWFADQGRGYTLHVRDDERDADLIAAAESAGLARLLDSPEMICHARLAGVEPPDDIDLAWVHDVDGVRDFISAAGRAFASLGMPEQEAGLAITEHERLLDPCYQTVVAYREGTPIAAAQTFLSHGIAGVYWVSTLEEARGRGLGELVTRAVTNRAFDLGAQINTLQASPMGEPIYRRMGYEEIGRYLGYLRFV